MKRREALQAKDEKRPPRTLYAWDFLIGVQDQTRQGVADPAPKRSPCPQSAKNSPSRRQAMGLLQAESCRLGSPVQ